TVRQSGHSANFPPAQVHVRVDIEQQRIHGQLVGSPVAVLFSAGGNLERHVADRDLAHQLAGVRRSEVQTDARRIALWLPGGVIVDLQHEVGTGGQASPCSGRQALRRGAWRPVPQSDPAGYARTAKTRVARPRLFAIVLTGQSALVEPE